MISSVVCVVGVCVCHVCRAKVGRVMGQWVPEITRFCPGVPIILVAGDVHLRSDASALQKLAVKGESLVTEEEVLSSVTIIVVIVIFIKR